MRLLKRNILRKYRFSHPPELKEDPYSGQTNCPLNTNPSCVFQKRKRMTSSLCVTVVLYRKSFMPTTKLYCVARVWRTKFVYLMRTKVKLTQTVTEIIMYFGFFTIYRQIRTLIIWIFSNVTTVWFIIDFFFNICDYMQISYSFIPKTYAKLKSLHMIFACWRETHSKLLPVYWFYKTLMKYDNLENRMYWWVFQVTNGTLVN